MSSSKLKFVNKNKTEFHISPKEQTPVGERMNYIIQVPVLITLLLKTKVEKENRKLKKRESKLKKRRKIEVWKNSGKSKKKKNVTEE